MRWQWHQLDHMQIICTSLQTDNHTSTLSLNFLQGNALLDAVKWVSVCLYVCLSVCLHIAQNYAPDKKAILVYFVMTTSQTAQISLFFPSSAETMYERYSLTFKCHRLSVMT